MKKQIKRYNSHVKDMEAQHKRFAFTLIELLFVITVIGVLATLGMALMQQSAQKSKVEKAALQMQQIMQAALTYYADNNCWPGATSGCSSASPPAFSAYLPFNSTSIATPWGGTYSYGYSGNNFQACSSANASTTGSLSNAIASRLAGLFPSGISTTGGTSTLCGAYTVPTTSCTSNCIAVGSVGKPGPGSSSPPTPSGMPIVAVGSVTWKASATSDELDPQYGTANACTFYTAFPELSVKDITLPNCATGTNLKMLLFVGSQAGDLTSDVGGITSAANFGTNVNGIKDLNFYYGCDTPGISSTTCHIHSLIDSSVDVQDGRHFPLSCNDPGSTPTAYDQHAHVTISYIAYCVSPTKDMKSVF